MIKINHSPVPTAQNYGVNYLEVDEKLLDQNYAPFNNFEINKVEGIEIKDAKINFENLISKKLETTTNFSKKINIKKSTKTPLQINFNLEKENVHSTIEINQVPNTNATIIIKFLSKKMCSINTQIHSNIAKNSTLNLIIFNNANANNFLALTDIKNENSVLNYHLIDFCKNTTVHNLKSTDESHSSKLNVNTIFFANDNSVLDFNYLVECTHAKTECNLNTVGALNNFAQKTYRGTINFLKGSKKSVGAENELCLLLSDDARSKSLPMILCTEEDVDGSHASSSGSIDENSLFYLETRGLNKKEATKLLIKAKFEQSIKLINDEKIRKEIINELDGKLDE